MVNGLQCPCLITSLLAQKKHSGDKFPLSKFMKGCERFKPRSPVISRLSIIVRVNIVLNGTVVDSDNKGDFV